MNLNKRILVAIDDSEASNRALTYLATWLRGKNDFCVRLFHVLRPLPPELLEFPGSENLTEEEKLAEEKKTAQARWLEAAEDAARPVFTKAKTILQTAHVPTDNVETQVAATESGRDVVTAILEEAEGSRCRTVVVGRKSFSWFQELFQYHVGDDLVRRSQGLTVWIVE